MARLEFLVHKLAINVVSYLLCHIITAGYPQLGICPPCSSVDLQDRHSGSGIGECLLIACSCEPCRQFWVSDSGSCGFREQRSGGESRIAWRTVRIVHTTATVRESGRYPWARYTNWRFSTSLYKHTKYCKGATFPKTNLLRYEDASISASDAAIRDLVYHLLIMH